MTGVRVVIILIIAVISGISLALSGCASTATNNVTPTIPVDKGNPKLDSQLNGLIKAETDGEAENFAVEHSIDIAGGKVRVEIDCEISRIEEVSAAVRQYGGIVEASYKNLLQAVVPVSALESLTEETGIRSIRLPMEMLPGTDIVKD